MEVIAPASSTTTNSQVDVPKVQIAESNASNMALLVIMWASFALTFGLCVSVLTLFGCRKRLSKQNSKQVRAEPQWPGDAAKHDDGDDEHRFGKHTPAFGLHLK